MEGSELLLQQPLSLIQLLGLGGLMGFIYGVVYGPIVKGFLLNFYRELCRFIPLRLRKTNYRFSLKQQPYYGAYDPGDDSIEITLPTIYRGWVSGDIPTCKNIEEFIIDVILHEEIHKVLRKMEFKKIPT